MDRRDDPAEERDARDRGGIDLARHEGAGGTHSVDTGVRPVRRHDERDGQDAREAHPDEQPAAKEEQPRTAIAPLALTRLRNELEDLVGQETTHDRNDGWWAAVREWTPGWLSLPRRYYRG